MKKAGYIVAVVIVSLIIGLIFFYLSKVFNHSASLQNEQQLAEQIDREMVELQALGFSSDDSLMVALTRCKEQLADHLHAFNVPNLQQVLALQKKMLMSYITEAKLLRNQGVRPNDIQMRFAYDKIVRLTIGVAELERQSKRSEGDLSEFQKRVERMKEITRQSIAHYKQQIRKLAQRGTSENDARMRHARDMLATRIKHFYQM